MINKKKNLPWASGPGELLKHGLDLLANDTDTNRRLAMISIDNSIELSIRTYLSLPSRVTGLKISRKELEEIEESFPKLLDALQKYAHDKVGTVDLGYIEWCHRIRNLLYHEGNGITVEREKVKIYSEIANDLFHKLFGFRILITQGKKDELIIDFFRSIQTFEESLNYATIMLNGVFGFNDGDFGEDEVGDLLFKKNKISKKEAIEFNNYYKLRNKIIQNKIALKEILNKATIKRFDTLSEKIYIWVDKAENKYSRPLTPEEREEFGV